MDCRICPRGVPWSDDLIHIQNSESRPVLKLHRGGVVTPDSPENTLSALRKAMAWEADMVEIDLRQTRDGYALLSHDPTLERLCGDPRTVATLALAEAQRLRVAGTDEPLAEFEDVCRLAGGGAIGLTLDIKDRTPALCRRVVHLLERYGMQSATIAPGDVPLFWGRCFIMLSAAWVNAYVDVQGGPPEQVVVGDRLDSLSAEEVGRLHGMGCLCYSAAVESSGQSAAEGRAKVRGDLERVRAGGLDGLIIDAPYFDLAIQVLDLAKMPRDSMSLRPADGPAAGR